MRKCLLLLAFLASPLYGQNDPRQWSASVETGYGYDSNVVVDDVDLNTETGDHFYEVGFSGGVDWQVRQNLELTGDIVLNQKRYNNVDNLDGQLGMLSLGLEREFEKIDLSLGARLIDYQLDGRGFLDLVQLSSSLSTFPSKKTYLRATYEYSDEQFDVDRNRDNTQDKFSIRAYYFINGLQQYVLARVQYSDDEADDDLFNNSTRQFSINYRYLFENSGRPVTLGLGYRYSIRDYDDELHPLLADFRKDRRRRAELRLDWQATKRLEVQFRVFRSNYRSNLATADYDQGVGQLTLKYALSPKS